MALDIDFSNFAPLQRNRTEYYNRMALKLLNGQRNNKKEKVLKDEFIRSEAVQHSLYRYVTDKPSVTVNLAHPANADISCRVLLESC